MTEFWEKLFGEEQTNRGFEPSDSAIRTKDFFLKNSISNILIPGIGYGRNAKIFHENGITVTGIEISKTALDLAKSKNGFDSNIYHGSVINMPFDDCIYDGVFCYALIHFLNKGVRKKLIQDCYNQLSPNGYMIFTVISKKTSNYGNGRFLSHDRYEIMKGLNVFFYDLESVKQEFRDCGLIEVEEIDEPIKHMDNEPALKCLYVKCKKTN